MRRWGENFSSASPSHRNREISGFRQIKNLAPPEARPEELLYTSLENKLQRELQDARVVRSVRLQQSIAEATGIAG